MNPDWAAEQLRTIRTLMERTAVYRRALAPSTLLAGNLGLFGGIFGWTLPIDSPHRFISYWMTIACITLGASILVVRRQAINEAEAFWSPPTRRVALAAAPPLAAGLAVSIAAMISPAPDHLAAWRAVSLWMLLYGCALHSAGFFMARGIRLLGWAFVLMGGCFALFTSALQHLEHLPPIRYANIAMGGGFGVIHLAYGTYLRRTETPTGEAE